MKKSKSNVKDYTTTLENYRMKPLPEEEHIATKKAKRFCKKCGKEVVPYKEQKTAGKRAANFFAFFIGVGPVYTYPKRCPYCNKILRTKTQKIVLIIFLVIWLIIAIIAGVIRLGPLL